MLSCDWWIFIQSADRKWIGRAMRILAFGKYFIEQANEKPKRFFFISKNQNYQTSNIVHSLTITDTWIWFIISIHITVLFTSPAAHSDFQIFVSWLEIGPFRPLILEAMIPSLWTRRRPSTSSKLEWTQQSEEVAGDENKAVVSYTNSDLYA